MEAIKASKRKTLPEAPVITTKTVSILPEELKFQEDPTLYAEYLPNDENQKFPLACVHSGEQAYRGNDRPSWKVGKDGKDRLRVANPSHCMVHLKDAAQLKVFGWPSSTFPQGTPDGHSVKVIYKADTQRPCVSINITIPEEELETKVEDKTTEGEEKKIVTDPNPDTEMATDPPAEKQQKKRTKKVTYEIYANSIMRSDDDVGIEFGAGTSDRVSKDGLPQHPKIEELAKAHNLWRTDIFLYTEDKQPEVGTTARPVWAGINPQEREHLAQLYDAGKEKLSNMQRLIVLLGRSNEISLLQEWEASLSKYLAPFFDYFRTVVYASAHGGNFWWYELAHFPKGSNKDDDYPCKEVPFPRWIVTLWRVTYSDDKPISAEQVSCKPFKRIESGVYPDADTYAFENRLGTAREALCAAAAIEKVTLDKKVSVTATFFSYVEGHYVAALNIIGVGTEGTRTPIPDQGTKLELGVRVGGKPLQLMGTIIEDVFHTGAQFCAAVSTNNPNAPKIQDGNEPYLVSIKYPHDLTPSNRCMVAISNLSRGQEKKTGVCLPEVALGAPRPKDWKTDFLYRKFHHVPAAKVVFDQEVHGGGLNEKQIEALELVTRKDFPGCALYLGPPGTGKTKTLVRLIRALLAAGFKGIVTSSNNTAVDKLYEDLMESGPSPAGVKPDEVVRFTGAYAHMKAFCDDKPQGDHEDGKVDPLAMPPLLGDWDDKVIEEDKEATEAGKAALFEHVVLEAAGPTTKLSEEAGFARKKLQYIESCLERVEFELDKNGKQVVNSMGKPKRDWRRDSAIEYQELLGKLKAARSEGRRPAKEDRAKFRITDEVFSGDFLQFGVKLVFCTNSTACHDELAEHYKPMFLIMDGAGTASPPDTMTPMAAHKSSLRVTVLGGDFKQGGPHAASKGKSEVADVVTTSMFEHLCEDPHKRFPMILLDTQYRMDPVLSEFPRTVIYKQFGELKDADEVKFATETPEVAIIKNMLDPLRQGGAWNGRVRLGIDCTGPSSFADKTSTSPQNESEAHRAAQLAAGLLALGVPKEKIIIISPYLGQRSKIQENLRGQTVHADGRQIRVSSTRSVQGQESDIVILSLVQHREDPNDIGFIFDPRQVTVEITRSRKFLFVLANFKGWGEVIKRNDKDDFIMKKDCKIFRGFIRDMLDKADVIAEQDFEMLIVQGRDPKDPRDWEGPTFPKKKFMAKSKVRSIEV